MPSNPIDFDLVRDLAAEFAGVEASTIHGAPSLKVRGKLLACPALHKSAEPNSVVVRIGFEERAQLISAKPCTYYLTEHYSNYPMVLVRLAKIDRKSLRGLLEKSWLFAGTKAASGAPKPPSRGMSRRASPRQKT